MTEEIEVSPTGGKNSKIEGRWDLLDYWALARAAAVLDYGARKYGDDNWRLDSVNLHLKHAIGHLFRYLENQRVGSRQVTVETDELAHAFVRLMFALALDSGGTCKQQ